MALKVCVYTAEHVLHWCPLYVEAFRARFDTVVIGPPLNTPTAQADLVRNDIHSMESDAVKVLDLLPSGWRPDVFVCVQSSAPTLSNVPKLAIPTVYISVDTWHGKEQLNAPFPYDFAFYAQKMFVDGSRDTGVRHPVWMPLACNPQRHFPVQREKEYDISFVGSTHLIAHVERLDRLQFLERHFSVDYGQAATPEEICGRFAAGKLAFNTSAYQDLNMRVFEVMAMGCPLLTARDAESNGLFELFEEGKHFIG